MNDTLSPREVDAQAQVSAACDIIRRLVDLLHTHTGYDYNEERCPNGKPACLACRLVTEAQKFVADNAGAVPRRGSDVGTSPLLGKE